jgi:hypothetical protein
MECVAGGGAASSDRSERTAQGSVGSVAAIVASSMGLGDDGANGVRRSSVQILAMPSNGCSSECVDGLVWDLHTRNGSPNST